MSLDAAPISAAAVAEPEAFAGWQSRKVGLQDPAYRRAVGIGDPAPVVVEVPCCIQAARTAKLAA